jgi:lipoate-protein ligase A
MALQHCNIKGLSQRGLSDICIGDKKILGSSLYMPRGRAHYQASLLVHCDLNIMFKYLKHPSREPDYRRGRRHEDFLTTLKFENYDIPMFELKKNIEKELHVNLRTVN